MKWLQGKNPFADCNSEEEVKNRVCNGMPPKLPEERWSLQFVDFVANCLLQDADERASASELLNVRSVCMNSCAAPVLD